MASFALAVVIFMSGLIFVGEGSSYLTALGVFMMIWGNNYGIKK